MTTIKELRELCAKAVPLPYDTGGTSLYETEGFDDLIESHCCDSRGHFRDEKTCAYVVAACNAIPQLLDLLDRMAVALKASQKELLLIKDDAFCEHNVGICSCSYWRCVDLNDKTIKSYEAMKGKNDDTKTDL